MWKSKRLSKLQVSGSMPRGTLGEVIETNLRLIVGDATKSVTCRRVAVESGIWSDDLRQTICSVLRRRDRLIAVPSPAERHEILVAGSEYVSCEPVKSNHWHAKVNNVDRTFELRFTEEPELNLIANLAQKALVLGFEASGSHWRLGNSARYWHAQQPVKIVDGVEAIPRVSFATLTLAGPAIGIALDSGFLYQTEQSVAYFFDPRVSPREREYRQKRFERLTSRRAGFKGTLVYDTGSNEHQVCYFERFGNGQTLATTGPIMEFPSLYKYCLARHKYRGYRPDDLVAYVSFRGLPGTVAVPAERLRVRVMLARKKMPDELKRATSTSASARRKTIVNLWDGCNKSGLKALGLRPKAGLWRPDSRDHELLPCPELIFGKGRRVAPPAHATIYEYQRHYKERMSALRNGGVLRFEPSAGREVYLVTPSTSSSWPDTLHKAFVEDFTESISDFVGQTFSFHEVRADAYNTPAFLGQ